MIVSLFVIGMVIETRTGLNAVSASNTYPQNTKPMPNSHQSFRSGSQNFAHTVASNMIGLMSLGLDRKPQAQRWDSRKRKDETEGTAWRFPRGTEQRPAACDGIATPCITVSVIREVVPSGVVVGSAPVPGLTASAKTCCGHTRQYASQIEAWRIARDIKPGRDLASEGDRPVVARRSECQHVGSRFDALATHGPIVAALGAGAPRMMNKVLDARTSQRGGRLEPAVATIDRRSPISGKEERKALLHWATG